MRKASRLNWLPTISSANQIQFKKILKFLIVILFMACLWVNLISCKNKNGEIYQKQNNGLVKIINFNCKNDFIEIESFSPFSKYDIHIYVPYGDAYETTWVKMKTKDGMIIDSSYSIYRNEDRLKELAGYIEKGKSDSFEGVYLDAQTWQITSCNKIQNKKFEIINYIIQNRENCTKESLVFNKSLISVMSQIEIGTRKNKDIIHEAMVNAKLQFNSNGYKGN